MTSIFICLLAGQRWAKSTVVVAAVSAIGVVVLKAIGAGSLAVLLGALVGIFAGMAFEAAGREGRRG